MKIIEQIKTEIDKRYTEYRKKMKTNDFTYYEGMADALDLFEQFIDTLESEKSVSNDFKEAAVKYADETYYAYPPEFLDFVKEEIRDAFNAGAKWQKEQMMKDVMDAEISAKFPIIGRSLISVIDTLKNFKYGDKVRIIIIKED